MCENGEDERPVNTSQAVECIGCGRAQLLPLFLGGSVYFMGGAALLLASTLSEPLSQAWQLQSWQRGALMSALFVGLMIGNSTSGPMGDTFGRKGMIVASYVGTFVFGVLCYVALDFQALAILRCFLGIALGLGMPPWIVLCTEITPGAWRMLMNAGSQSLFVAGELYVGFLMLWDDSTLKHLDWRSLSAIGHLPAIMLAAFAFFFLTQSPAYLATKGEHSKAREVLRRMARYNGVVLDFNTLVQEPPAKVVGRSSFAQLDVLFGTDMIYSTLTVIYTIFVLNVIFYGTLYAFPQVARTGNMGISPGVSVLVGALFEIPGLVGGALFGTWFRRLPVIVACSAGMFGALSLFVMGVTESHLWYTHYVLHLALVGIKIFSNIAFVVVYQYSAEIYPAFARTTGNAVCVSCGRLGAILAPIIFEGLVGESRRFSSFFILLAILAVANFALALFLPFETAGMDLDDELEPICRKKQSSQNPWTIAARKLGNP